MAPVYPNNGDDDTKKPADTKSGQIPAWLSDAVAPKLDAMQGLADALTRDSALRLYTALQDQSIRTTPLDLLTQDLETLGTQVADIREQVDGNANREDLEQRIDELTQSLSRITQQSQEIKAAVVLPPREEMNVKLVTSTSLDHLEEYRSDLNDVYLLIGTFGGAALSMLLGWAASWPLIPTVPSVILFLLLLVLTAGCIRRATHIRQRADALRARMMGKSDQSP